MKILHISAVNNWGGGEHHIENLCAELKELNSEIKYLILCRKGGKFHKRLASSGLNFTTSALQINLDPRFILKIIRLCSNHKIDLIHLHDPRAMALAIIADQFADLPPMIFSKKISFPVRKRKQTLYKYNYHKIKKIFCVSEQTRKLMEDAIIDKDKLITIYHGTRVDNKCNVTSFLLRQKLEIPKHKKIIGNIANHHKAKNLETFVDVANYLVNIKNNKEFHFVQIGSFTERTPALKEKVRELNLQGQVSFLGFMPNASNFLPQFDISLITSTNEGMPQVIYESFYHEIPVVSTNVAGIPEVLEHKKNGLLADAYDYEDLGNNILSITANGEFRSRFVINSKEKLHENFTTAMMAEKMMAEYIKVLHGKL